jgi:hypothetical protein
MKALISNNEVVDIQYQEFEVHPSLVWVPCDSSVRTGDKYINGVFTTPEVMPIPYDYARKAEYPPIGDQLDALWKGGAAAEDMLARIQEIKNKYPKGDA